MRKPRQKRTLETRARLIAAAEAVVEQSGYEALRVEEVVLRAGVAKGTFFAHFGDKDELMDSFLRLNDFSMQRLGLRIGKWQVSPTSRGINFLGYRIWAGHKLLRKDSVTRAKRKVARYSASGDQESLDKFIASWCGHAKGADSHSLISWMEKQHGIACH